MKKQSHTSLVIALCCSLVPSTMPGCGPPGEGWRSPVEPGTAATEPPHSDGCSDCPASSLAVEPETLPATTLGAPSFDTEHGTIRDTVQTSAGPISFAVYRLGPEQFEVELDGQRMAMDDVAGHVQARTGIPATGAAVPLFLVLARIGTAAAVLEFGYTCGTYAWYDWKGDKRLGQVTTEGCVEAAGKLAAEAAAGGILKEGLAGIKLVKLRSEIYAALKPTFLRVTRRLLQARFNQGTRADLIRLVAGLIVEVSAQMSNAIVGVLERLTGTGSGGNGCISGVASGHWRVEFYSNMALSGPPQLVIDGGPTGSLSSGWGTSSPSQGCNLPADQFSARWTGSTSFEQGVYEFRIRSDDGVRIWIDGQLALSEWHDSPANTYTFPWAFSKPGQHQLKIEYFENQGNTLLQVSWTKGS